MARKRKPITKNTPKQSLTEQEKQAATFFERTLYKDAITGYKNLLKIENRDEWTQKIAQAYLLQSLDMAKQKLYQNAIVSWEKYAQISDEQQAVEKYLIWLSYGKHYIKIARFSTNKTQILDKSVESWIHNLLAVALLAGEDKITTILTADNPVIAHYQMAKSALHAYCEQDRSALETSLKQIPFRSPYKDFRVILKGLVSMETDRDAAIILFNKIPDNSPYLSFVKLCQLQGLSEPEHLKFYARLGQHGRSFIQTSSGLNKVQITFLKKCQRLFTHYTDKQALEIVMKNRILLGQQRSDYFALSLLPFYPAGKHLVQSTVFMSVFDKQRLKTLVLEKEKNLCLIRNNWYRCLEILEEKNLSEEILTRALIMRHMINFMDKTDNDDINEIINLLSKSLELDPKDKACYLQLIEFLKKQNKTKELAIWLIKALQHYPDDVDILMLLVSESMKKRVFKKAVTFAKKVLKVDPINQQARHALINCHISHARKLINNDKYKLAEKELVLTETVEKGKQSNGLLSIIRGLLAFKTGDKKHCYSLVEQGLNLEKNDLCGHFRLTIEILNLGLSVATVSRSCPKLNKKYQAEKNDLIALASLIGSYHQENNIFINKAFENIKVIFKQSLIKKQSHFSADELENLCYSLNTFQNFEMLGFVANIALKVFSKKIIFNYYQVYSKCNGNIKNITDHDAYNLDRVLIDATDNGINDPRGVAKIRDLLIDYENNQSLSWINEENNDYDNHFPPIAKLFELGLDMGKFIKINHEVSEMNEQELFKFLFDGKNPSLIDTLKFKSHGEEKFQQLILEKILEKSGINKKNVKSLNLDALESILLGTE